MSKRISQYMLQRSLEELEELKAKLPLIEEEYRDAAERGDVSENAELDAARTKLLATQVKIASIESLKDYEVLEYDTSPIIKIGSLVKIEMVALDETIILMLEQTGGALIEGVLNVDSEMGKAIIGGVSKDVKVNGKDFRVTKILDPEFLKEFTKLYPKDDIIIQRLFDEVSGGE